MSTKQVYPLVCVLMLAGCAVGPQYHTPSVETPTHYQASGAASSTDHVVAVWWTLFNDAQLNELEQQVSVSNQNIAAAAAAYQQALSAVSVQRATLFPAIDVSAGAERANANKSNRSVTTRGVENAYSASVSASWSVDVWGRLRRTLENARASAEASAADLAAATLGNQSLLASSYLQLREADAELNLLADTVATYEKAAQITRNRYQAGAAAKSDTLQADAQLANTQADYQALQLQRAQLQHAIAALVGKAASDFSIAALPDWQPTVPTVPAGIPSQLLRQRPDIVAAERRMAAASANIGIQKSAYFPALTLTGSDGFEAAMLRNLFDPANAVWSVAANAVGTVFDAGATTARVRGARAAYDISVAQYRQTVLDAFRDVEDQLAGTQSITQQAQARQAAATAALEARQLLMNQYNAGRLNYTEVVSAQTTALSAQRDLARAQLARQTNSINLIAALGGGWTVAVQ